MSATPSPHAASEGLRDARVAARNLAIETAAMALAEARVWPSPAAVADRTKISESVVKRETSRLTTARRAWVRRVGCDHPQWVDPGRVGPRAGRVSGTEPTGGDDAAGSDPTWDEGNDDAVRVGRTGGDAAPDAADPPGTREDAGARDKATRKRLRRQVRDLRWRLGEAEELVRRMNLGVRPAEIDLILETGAKNRGTGKA